MINLKHLYFKDEKIFVWAFMLSMAVHLMAAAGLSYSNLRLAPRPLKRLEVKYRVVQRSSAVQPTAPQAKNMDVQKVKKTSPHPPVRQPLPDSLIKEAKIKSQFEGVTKAFNKGIAQALPSSAKRNISVPIFESEKISNPRYLSFYSGIREKIRQRAHLYENNLELMNNSEFQEGEVYLTFVLMSDGSLKRIQLIEDKTSANAYLRRIGLSIIKESSPFSEFPQDLNYPELSFNMVISFEKKQ